MNINLEKLQDTLCKMMCADVNIHEKDGRISVVTPFEFADGDAYSFILEERPGGILKMTDSGDTFMHLSYENDIDKMFQGTRGKLLEQILQQSGATYSEGEIYIETSPEKLGESIFRFSQVLTNVNDLTFLNRARIESTFYEDLHDILMDTVEVESIEKDYIYRDMSNAEDYPIDYRLPGKLENLFVFGIPNKDKARLVTIVLERLLRAEAEFDSVLVFAEQGTIPRPDLARLSNVGGEMVASLDAIDDFKRKINKRAAA